MVVGGIVTVSGILTRRYAVFVDGYDPALLMDANADYLAENAMFNGVGDDYLNAAAYAARFVKVLTSCLK